MSAAGFRFLSLHSPAIDSVSHPTAAVLSISDLAIVAATMKSPAFRDEHRVRIS